MSHCVFLSVAQQVNINERSLTRYHINIISKMVQIGWCALHVDRSQISLQQLCSSASLLSEPPSAAGFLPISPGLFLHILYPLFT